MAVCVGKYYSAELAGKTRRLWIANSIFRLHTAGWRPGAVFLLMNLDFPAAFVLPLAEIKSSFAVELNKLEDSQQLVKICWLEFSVFNYHRQQNVAVWIDMSREGLIIGMFPSTASAFSQSFIVNQSHTSSTIQFSCYPSWSFLWLATFFPSKASQLFNSVQWFSTLCGKISRKYAIKFHKTQKLSSARS